MTSGTPISRRRFLAVIGGTGVAAASGFGSWKLLIGSQGPEPMRPIIGSGSVPPELNIDIVEVQPGFVDATVWNDELFTLRVESAGTVLRSETTGTDYPVDTPGAFTARCIGVTDDIVIIGGHQRIAAGSLVYESGPPYRQLVNLGGADAEALLSEPARFTASPHEHLLVDHVPSIITAREMGVWRTGQLRTVDPLAGSCGAVLENSGTLAIDHYLDAESPDSIYEVVLMDVASALAESVSVPTAAVAIDHGHIWGTAFDGKQDLLVITDRTGTRGLDDIGSVKFELEPSIVLEAINPSGQLLDLTVEISDGSQERWTLSGQFPHQTIDAAPASGASHRISRDIVVVAVERGTEAANPEIAFHGK